MIVLISVCRYTVHQRSYSLAVEPALLILLEWCIIFVLEGSGAFKIYFLAIAVSEMLLGGMQADQTSALHNITIASLAADRLSHIPLVHLRITDCFKQT